MKKEIRAPRLPGWLVTAGQTLAVAFGMFSALPVPQPAWNEKNMKYALCAFPLVGAVIALAFGAWGWLAAVLGLPELLRAAGFCLVPVLLTGGIHLDGYADTSDALASYGGQDKRLEILKDPRCGAFAVIRLCSWFAADLALCAALPLTPRAVGCMQLGFVLERAISGWAVAALPLAKHTGLAHTFSTAAARQRVKLILTGIILGESFRSEEVHDALILARWAYPGFEPLGEWGGRFYYSLLRHLLFDRSRDVAWKAVQKRSLTEIPPLDPDFLCDYVDMKEEWNALYEKAKTRNNPWLHALLYAYLVNFSGTEGFSKATIEGILRVASPFQGYLAPAYRVAIGRLDPRVSADEKRREYIYQIANEKNLMMELFRLLDEKEGAR